MTQTRRLAAIAFSVLFIFAQSARAQDGEKEEIIRDLLVVTNSFAMMNQMMDLMAPQIWAAIKKLRPEIPDSLISILQEEMTTAFSDSEPEFANALVSVYSKHFTADELRDLLAFYRTEIGRKTIEVMPSIIAETTAIGTVWGRRVSELAAEKAVQRLRDKGYEL